MNPEIEALRREIEELKVRLARFERKDRFIFENPIHGGTRGLRIGASKIGFFGTEPTEKYSFVFNGVPSGTWGASEQATLNGIRLALDAYGLIRTS